MFQPSSSSLNVPQLFTQEELNDLVRDLGLSKDLSEILGSRLKHTHLLAPGITFYWYRHRESEFINYFEKPEPLVYFKNIVDPVISLDAYEYKPADWILFIDLSKRSLKDVFFFITATFMHLFLLAIQPT